MSLTRDGESELWAVARMLATPYADNSCTIVV
jgi:hypothetical protein